LERAIADYSEAIRLNPKFLLARTNRAFTYEKKGKFIEAVCTENLIRIDCVTEQHLHLLNSYQKYYNEARTHRSLHKDAPIPRAVQTVGRTLAMPVLAGLHHQYFRA
jgi:ribulose-5-phosphate 4-epimerase/fuculose-1-phosphate aldolase